MSPELREMRQELRRLNVDKSKIEREDRRLRQGPTLRVEDPILEQLRPEDRALVERINQSTIESMPESLTQEIESLNDKFAEELGSDLSETFKSDEIHFDPNDSSNFWKNITELQDSMRRPLSNARQQYIKAMEAYKNTWPTDSVPPSEWIEKVQPYINPELVRQIADVRKARESSKDDSPTSGRSGQRKMSPNNPLEKLSSDSLGSTPKQNRSHRILESLISAVDRKGTEWLKSSKGLKANRSQSSWWKTLKARSKRKLSALNRTATQHSNRMTQRRSDTWTGNLSSHRQSSDAVDSAGDRVSGGTVLAFFGLIALVGAAVYSRWSRTKYVAERDELPLYIDSTIIRDRESLLRACHQLSHRCFGWPSRYWNHRQVFSRLCDTNVGYTPAFEQLSHIYEHARYAPNGVLSPEELAYARRLYAQVQDVSPVAL